MPNIKDIREKDEVLIEIPETDISKVVLLNGIYQTGLGKYFRENVFSSGHYKESNSDKLTAKVSSVKYTEKNRIEYAILSLSQGPERGMRFAIQTRYLKLLERKSSHRRTSIFL